MQWFAENLGMNEETVNEFCIEDDEYNIVLINFVRKQMKVERKYTFSTGQGKRWITPHTVTVQCVEQRGKFYANVDALNPGFSKYGISSTLEAAFDAWENLYCAKRIG